MEPKVLVIGNSVTDVIIPLSSLPRKGETVFGDTYTIAGGGKGANQAIALKRLGCEVTLISQVGLDNFGANTIQRYVDEGLSVEHIFVDPDHPTGLAFIMVDRFANNTITVSPGANLNVGADRIKKLENLIKNSDILLIHMGIDLPAIIEAITIAHHYDTFIILDPAPANKSALDISPYVNILTPNIVELGTLCDCEINSVDDAITAAQHIVNKDLITVIVKMDSRGALIVNKSQCNFIPSFKVNAIDATGAGDAFNAALALSIYNGQFLDESVLNANAVGALAATKLGAQPSLPYKYDVVSFLDINQE